MKFASTAARYLLGIMFTVFGLNRLFHFIPQPPPAPPLALEYLTVLSTTHYFAAVFVVQLTAGLLLLANRFVPLAVALLAPILVKVLLFHGMMKPGGISPGVFATILSMLLFVRIIPAFDGFAAASPIVE